VAKGKRDYAGESPNTVSLGRGRGIGLALCRTTKRIKLKKGETAVLIEIVYRSAALGKEIKKLNEKKAEEVIGTEKSVQVVTVSRLS